MGLDSVLSCLEYDLCNILVTNLTDNALNVSLLTETSHTFQIFTVLKLYFVMSSNPNARRGVPEKLTVSEKVGNSKKPSASYPSSPDSGRSSPGSSCSICLRRHENKSYTNNCLHEFCFTCLLEWSKVKPECPLCKQAFTSIIHNVRANHEYDEHKIPLVDLEEPDVFDQLLHHQSYYR
ncbi:E3 ubiquitin-protein ligase Topors-like [Daphnia carinata]|uniref:E3 ubiquitin-protein ligase Topors-like n=1 Tax=Daphnia carinata TaxID=120202 RepID=UPI0028685CB5|nr:E3 ubiquitin-protein ligase Topors-like [Daphnia carinata]